MLQMRFAGPASVNEIPVATKSCPRGYTRIGTQCIPTPPEVELAPTDPQRAAIESAIPAYATPGAAPTQTAPIVVDQPQPGTVVTAPVVMPTLPAMPYGLKWWQIGLGVAGVLGLALVISRAAR